VTVRFRACGDAALTVEFGDTIDREFSEAVLGLDGRLRACELAGLIETVPTFRSLLIEYDPLVLSLADVEVAVEAALLGERRESRPGRRFELPVCYEPAVAPDLEQVAARAGLDTDGVVRLHTGVDFHVYMIGFLPGFPYMGDLPEPLVQPRRQEPRVRLPAGSVAIATSMTAVYPLESPGGWHLIGRCPVRLFDPGNEPPALLAPGDTVRFTAIDGRELERLSAAAAEGSYVPQPQERPR
jgi:inhibitor of KinA